MRTGKTMLWVTSGWIPVLAFLWLQSNQAECQTVGTTGDSGTFVHFTNDISEGEKKSTCARAKVVQKWYEQQGVTIALEDVPSIAFVASGGGMTAAISFLGALVEMKKQGLLDAFMYIFGCSGSTWGMTELYDNGDWVPNLDKLNEAFCKRIANPLFDVPKALAKLLEASKGEDYSLTDVWCATLIFMVLKVYNEHNISGWAPAVQGGQVPFPICSAADKDRLRSSSFTNPGTYFENTPISAACVPQGPFVEAPYFKSKFEDGKLVEKQPEPTLCYLNAVWGSAFAYEPKLIADVIDAISLVMIDPKEIASAPPAIMPRLPAGKETKFSYNVTKIINDNWSSFNNTIKQKAVILLTKLVTIESLPLIGLTDVSSMFLKTMKCFATWEWGTTNNFAKRKDSADPSKIHLIDAGAGSGMRTPFVQALHTPRSVSLMVVLEVGTDNTFATLEKARQYCSANNIPFPFKAIPPGEGTIANYSCYIFEEQNSGTAAGGPIVVHMPLFNKQNDKGENTRTKYPFFRTTYMRDEIDAIQAYAKENVMICADRIRQKMIELAQQNKFIKRAACPAV